MAESAEERQRREARQRGDTPLSDEARRRGKAIKAEQRKTVNKDKKDTVKDVTNRGARKKRDEN